MSAHLPIWVSRGVPYLPWWPSCLDRGALINVDAPGCGTSVVRGLTGRQVERFSSWGTVELYPKVF